MSQKPDFTGIGAQRCGTSWIYACLYQHPEICVPRKEIHFFSREEHWERGIEWYESQFQDCSDHERIGEFSTSYLSDPDAPGRIANQYPNLKLITSLRNPVDRAYSSYRNDRAAGNIPKTVSFIQALDSDPGYIEAGKYGKYLARYLEWFDRKQLLVLIYEDSLHDPEQFIQSIYRHLEVNDSFEPSMLHERVNPSRTARFVSFEQGLNRISRFMKKGRVTRSLWWLAKQSGLGKLLRWINRSAKPTESDPLETIREDLHAEFREDISQLESLLDRTLTEWKP